MRMNGVILYQSKYGATKRYAAWLSEETGFPAIETRKAKVEDMQRYDLIILGGGVYASGIAGLSFLKRNIAALDGKRILAFFVGASPYEERSFREIVSRNMKGTLSDIPCFYCRGAWNPNGMTAIDRSLCRLLQKSLAKKPQEELEVWEKALFAAGDTPCDWTERRYLEPIQREIQKHGLR